MTKKYTVASSKIVRRIPDRPSRNGDPARKPMKMITANIMMSENGARVERKMPEEAGGQLPKNRESDTYAVSKRRDPGPSHRR